MDRGIVCHYRLIGSFLRTSPDAQSQDWDKQEEANFSQFHDKYSIVIVE
jgi:hypothetical protein